MTSIVFPSHASTRSEVAQAPCVELLSLGTAVPEICWQQDEIALQLAMLWGLDGAASEKWHRIVAGSGIDCRHGVMQPESAMSMTTAQRMLAYEHLAPPLADRAARRAIDAAGINAGEITDVVVVSCTGFAAPGLDVSLIERLGLGAATRRTTVGFMGCFGAINGLRVARGLCAADPRAVVLLVCAELCSLHVRGDRDPQNMVACALFADGAAAAVLAADGAVQRKRRGTKSPRGGTNTASNVIGVVGRGTSRLLPEGREWMTWRITDMGFAMKLTREVPVALRHNIAEFLNDDDNQSPAMHDETLIVHPGGPGVLEAVDTALNLRGGRGLDCSRQILRRFGNMSSATVLFVLEQALNQGCSPPFRLLAFGPGLTIEGLTIQAAQRASV